MTILVFLTSLVLGRFSTTSFGCDWTILFTLGRVYGGEEITVRSLHYSIST
ncbi:hypothetical protein E2C01_033005 [Portunus trituberculatus]|uniref:Uncharacterized protein n=1 Tax=Portunus trituberculatus TaxID=210409 RepID=A0A5B7F2T2_PORTR|nr:hypothetical protein [Portunus trituberculatus]